jgi:hypothetical protein
MNGYLIVQGEIMAEEEKYTKNFFESSPEPVGQFQSNLVQIIIELRELKCHQMKDQVLFKGEITTKIGLDHLTSDRQQYSMPMKISELWLFSLS